MEDFRRQAEEARLARIQGLRLRPIAEAPKNRIEEALGRPILKTDTVADVEAAPVVRPGKRYNKFLKKFFLGLAILTLLAVVGFGGYAVLKARRATPTTADQIIQAVGKLVELPAGQKPTVATVTDLKPLQDQAFFDNAQVGDKVLIFGDTQKAILYRPSTNKIIQIAPIDK